MRKILKLYILPFLAAACLCSAICFGLMSPLIFKTSDSVAANEQYLSAPYGDEASVLLLKLADLPISFTVEIDYFLGSCSVFCFPTKCISRSLVRLEPQSTVAEMEKFFSFGTDKYILADSHYLKNIINSVGGISILPKYNTPSPTGKDYLPFDDGELQIYGGSIIGLMAAESQPDARRMEHYAEIMCKVFAKQLSRLSKESFYEMIEKSETDISYADFYDFSKNVTLPFELLYSSSPSGEWSDGYFRISQ